MRRLISKLEIALGILLLALCAVRFGWCQWSLPRYGKQTPHGLETAMCNWGTELLTIGTVGIALGTMLSGVLGFRFHAAKLGWFAVQTPAALAWGWVAYALVYAFFIYPG